MWKVVYKNIFFQPTSPFFKNIFKTKDSLPPDHNQAETYQTKLIPDAESDISQSQEENPEGSSLGKIFKGRQSLATATTMFLSQK